jgi:hypothetical protein
LASDDIFERAEADAGGEDGDLADGVRVLPSFGLAIGPEEVQQAIVVKVV